jgi:hypothetical protein
MRCFESGGFDDTLRCGGSGLTVITLFSFRPEFHFRQQLE